MFAATTTSPTFQLNRQSQKTKNAFFFISITANVKRPAAIQQRMKQIQQTFAYHRQRQKITNQMKMYDDSKRIRKKTIIPCTGRSFIVPRLNNSIKQYNNNNNKLKRLHSFTHSQQKIEREHCHTENRQCARLYTRYTRCVVNVLRRRVRCVINTIRCF